MSGLRLGETRSLQRLGAVPAGRARLSDLLIDAGWYSTNGWRERSDPDRGIVPGLSAGEVVNELLRREAARAREETT